MPDNMSINVNDADYIKRINNMIEANNKLKESYTGLSSSMYSVNKHIDALSNNARKKSGSLSKNVKDEYSEALKEAQKYISMASSNAGTFLNTITGSKLAGNRLAGIISNIIKNMDTGNLKSIDLDISSILKSRSELQKLYSEKNNLRKAMGDASEGDIYEKYIAKALEYRKKKEEVDRQMSTLKDTASKANIAVMLKTLGTISMLTAATVGLYKAGQGGYKQSMEMSRSLNQLGDSAKYALDYAKDLNSELGVGLDKTLGKIAQVVTQLSAIGFTNEQASTIGVNVSDLSEKLARVYGEMPSDINEKIMRSIASGSNDLAPYGVNTSDDVMAAWIANTKGVNMYQVQISEAQMAAYRYEKTMQDLSDVVSYNGDIADNTWSRYLSSMEQLESIGKRIKQLLIPVFEQIVDWLDRAVTGVNKLFIAMGLTEDMVTSTSDLAERSTDYVSNVMESNAELKKQGELLKANAQASGKINKDSWNQLSAIKQLSNTDALDFGAIKANTGNAKDTGEDIGKAIKDAIEKSLTDTEIKNALRGSLEEAKDTWQKLLKSDLGSAVRYADEFANKFLNAGDYAGFLGAELINILGDITGINSILEFMNGNIADGLASGIQTVDFWFGGWKGKLVSVLSSLSDLDVGVVSLSGPLSMVFGAIGGWQGGLGIVSNLLKQIADGDIAQGVSGALAGVLIMLAKNKDAVAMLGEKFNLSHIGIAGIVVGLGSVLSGIYSNINGTQQWYDKLAQVLIIVGSLVTAFGVMTGNVAAIGVGIGMAGVSFAGGTLANKYYGTGAEAEQAEQAIYEAQQRTQLKQYNPSINAGGINPMYDVTPNFSTGLNYNSLSNLDSTLEGKLSEIKDKVTVIAESKEEKTLIQPVVNVYHPNIFGTDYEKRRFADEIAGDVALSLRERGELGFGVNV